LLAGAVGLYAASGWFGAPWVFDRWLASFEAEGPGRTASIATVRFNPFTLEAELEGLNLNDEPARASFSADKISIAISARSVWERRPILAAISVERPILELARPGQLAAILRTSRSRGISQARIDQLAIDDGSWLIGPNAAQPIDLAGIAGRLTGFDGRTGADARYRIDATAANGMSIESEGLLAPDLGRAAGELTVDGAQLATMSGRIGDIANGIEPQGRVALTGDFAATGLLGMTEFELNDAVIKVTDLSLTPLAGFSAESAQLSATANLVLTSADDRIDVRGRLAIADAAFELHDRNLMPVQTYSVSNAAGVLTADRGNTGLALSLSGELADAGVLTLTARAPAETSAASTVSLRLSDLPSKYLSAYSAQSVGRTINAGRADVGIDYSMLGDRVSGDFRLVARSLAFSPVDTQEGQSLDLAVALLENADGSIDVDLPFVGASRRVRSAVSDALSARIAALTATPFAALQSGAGDTAVPGVVPFTPGEAALNDRALATIGQLAEALNARPRLGLRVLGGYDEQADRTALARQQIQLHVLLATAGPTINARPRPVDFASPRAQDVLDEFAGERLAAERVTEIERLFDCGDGDLALLCRRGYYAAIFDALVANEEIANPALNRLARFRALSIVDALTGVGIEPARLEVDTGFGTIDTPFGIGLQVELTVAPSDGVETG
jgi:hypothetical protein